MHHYHHRLLAQSIAFAALVASVSHVQAAQTITTIATSNATGGFGLSVPSINNKGTVAFIDTSPGTNGLYSGNGGPLTTIITSPTLFNQYGAGGGTPSFDAGPIINDAGVVAFWANTTGVPTAPGILSGTQGGLNTIVSGPAPVGTTGITFYTGAPQISNNGIVAFAASRPGGSLGAGVFTGSGGALTPIISTDTESRFVVDPAISPGGVVAYEWRTANEFGGAIADNLYTLHNGITTTIAITPFALFDYIAVNDAGTVAASSTHLIQTGSGGPFTTLVNASGPFGSFGALSINDGGEVAFYGSLAFGGTGIYTGPDPILNKVIATGDSLLGSTVVQLAFGRRGLNDDGQVAFWARLANNDQGVFVINTVPEPTSLVLFAVGGMGLLTHLRQRRRHRATDEALAS